jgi:type VI secretion system protein ImpH
MAAARGTEDLTITNRSGDQFDEIARFLREHPGRFDFFQAVRLLLRLSAGRKPPGYFVNPDSEAVRFSAEPSLAFPTNNIADIRSEGDKALMRITFLGLTGPAGVLPRCYSSFLLARLREKDHALSDFLDLFNHRLASFFYRTWEKYRFGIAFERDGADRISNYLSCLIGLGTAGLENRLGIPDRSLLFYSGLLSLQVRSAMALQQILEDYFAVPAEVEQFVGVWRPLEPAVQCLFDSTESHSEQLGAAAVVGDEIWDAQSRIRLKLGPMRQEQYLSFLLSGPAWKPLCEITRFFRGPELEVEVQLILEHEDVPHCDLGKNDMAGPRLGWFTWIHSGGAFSRSPDDTLLLLG